MMRKKFRKLWPKSELEIQKKTIAKKYNIPRSTLQFRLSAKFTKTRHGPNTYLTSDEENMLVSWILESQEKGFPKRKVDLQLSVKQFLDEDERPNPFKENMPGKILSENFSCTNIKKKR